MATEIERKFLVTGAGWRDLADAGVPFRQGYIAAEAGRSVRVRVMGDRAVLTIKGPTTGITRSEFEYPIPVADAQTILDTLCPPPLIEKTRYTLQWGDLCWEIDEFAGANQGLILAEVELARDDQAIALPDWVGQDVSDDFRYYNLSLARHPYREWGTQ